MARIHNQNGSRWYARGEKQKQNSYPGCMGIMVNFFDLNNGSATSQKLLTETPHGEGNVHIRERIGVAKMVMDSSSAIESPTEDNSFPCELKSSSKPSSGMPMKMLITDEMSKETDTRRRSPSVIARLMGLDAFPAQPAQKHQRKASKSVQKTSGKHQSRSPSEAFRDLDTVFVEKHVSYESHSFRKVERLDTEKPDIFSSQRVMASSKLGESKMAFIRQKFMDAKRLSTNENLRHSKEFHDALEVLDSNKDLFMRILQEPDSLFTKHLHDLPIPPRPSHIRVLKSSNSYRNSELYQKSERKTKMDVKLPGPRNFQHEHEKSHVWHTKNAVYPSHKSSRSQMDGKHEARPLPARIVVLKPSLAKAQTPARSDHRKHREFRKSNDWGLIHEARDEFVRRRMPKNGVKINDEFVRRRMKGSREVAGEITRHMSQNASIGSVKLSRSARNGYAGGDERAYTITENDSENDSEPMTPISGNFYDWNDRFSPSSSYSRESSVSKEAKKHLLERWKLMHVVQDSGLVGRSSSSTLGEMLTLPEIESSGKEMGRDLTLDYMIGQDDSIAGFARNGELTRWGCPLGISSKDGWKEVCPRDVQQSRFVLQPERPVKQRSLNMKASSSGNRKSNGKKSKSVLHCLPVNDSHMENILHAAEIDSSSDGLGNKLVERDLSEQKAVIFQPSSGVDDTKQLGNCIKVEECGDLWIPSENHGVLLTKPSECISSSVEDGVADQNARITEVSSLEHPQSGSPQAHLKPGLHEMEPESPGSYKGTANQPSPVSVLEPSFEEEISTSECFEQVSADLHGLRMQLHLLKLESEDAYMVESSDEEYGEELGESPRMCHGENTDFSFVLNVLVSSGFHDITDPKGLAAAWYSPDLPVDPCIFEKVAKQYGGRQSAWSRSERRFMFDSINSSLMEVVGPYLDPCPWVYSGSRMVGPVPTREVLVEKVWRLLDQREKERGGESLEAVMKRDLEKERGWLELGDHVDVIGREMEGDLLDELLEEVVYGLCVGQ